MTSRTLTGVVFDKSDAPVSNAVVYLKNTKTLAVKTVIAGNDGSYRFPELSPNVDYEVYAQREGKKSDTKTLSQFDDRQNANIVLRINIGTSSSAQSKVCVRKSKAAIAGGLRTFNTIRLSCFRCWRASTT